VKIAVLSCDANPNNGWGVYTLNYCRRLHAAGFDFSLFLPKHHTRLTEEWSDNVAYLLPPLHMRYGHYRTAAGALMSLTPFRGFDIIHSLVEVPTAFIAYRAAKKYERPFVMTAHGTYGILPFLQWPGRRVFSRVLDRVDMLITPSEFTRRTMLAFYGKELLRERTRVIHNGVDFERFHAKAVPLEQKDPELREFVGVGALKPRKGFDIAIRAFQEVVERHPNTRYKVIGRGPEGYRKHLEALTRSLGLEEHVKFTGVLTREKLIEEMAGSYAYVHTPIARNWHFEGFGIVYVEANACGLPAIGSDSGGVPDAIVHGVTGLLVREHDPKTTAEAISELLEEPQQYRAMTQGAVDWAKRHDWSQIVQEYLASYQALI
jgi:glycosyltransferase involved in cell wall biosynthesis